LSLISGIDLRSSQLQGDYQTYKIWATSEKVNQSKVSLAEELGVVSNQGSGGNQFKTIDAGLYSQATFKAIDSLLYLTAGGRYDYNQIRTSGGFGGIFNPKLAVVITVKKVILKTIYAQGIQNASQFTKYSTFATRNSNPDLSPERIRNIEFVVQNRHGSIINWNISSFYSIIYDAISSATDLNDPQKQKNQNIGTYQIFGSQSNISFSPKKTNFNFQLNFTYTNAKQTENKTSTTFAEKTMGDIAPLKSNLIINYHKLIELNNFNFNLRTNFVGVKPVGPNTTVPLNKGFNNSEKIPGYTVFSFCITYKNTHFKYLTAQFTINNILNTLYYSPGPRTANGNYTDSYNGFVSFVPQQTRNFLLALTLNL
jgi:outer membrane cobalamin receptor